ncbi:MAG TPA: type II toxin-antitoxin system HicB family antitoxin [bacterium]|nr:type II toxin-antitoxin system HicB family antitoxin [bacterium]HQO34282.1 type II toxin-antitoxin system HicB family antitoxin [bacterium]
MQRTFTLEYWLDDGWYVGKLREVPGVFSQGETLDELEENIREAYDLMLEEAVQPQQSGMETKEITIGAE